MEKGDGQLMKWIIIIFSLVFSYVLGFTLNKGLSSTNTIINLNNKKDILNYDIPFIYTIGMNEICLILSITIIFFLCLYYYYIDSETSIVQLFKLLLKVIWIEIIIFSFIIGSWGNSLIENFSKNNFFRININVMFLSLISMIVFLLMSQYSSPKEQNEENNESDLYPSRKVLIPIIDEYLKSLNGFSIVGDWGIGKSKLIENFFYKEVNEKNIKYSSKYDLIYIDVAAYSDNKKIVDIIQNKLMIILKEQKILKIDIKLIEKVFFETQNFLSSLKQIFLSEISLDDSKKILELKLKEYKSKSNRDIVICIDNFERLSDPNRIINLLSIIDDLLSNQIKKIYSYDEKYMKEIFKEEKKDFTKFINKYAGIELKVNEIELKEIENIDIILSLTEELRIEFNEKINKKESEKREIFKNINFNPSELEIKKLDTIDNKIIELENGLLKINKKLSNPRYTEYLNSFVSNKAIKFEEKIKFEYRIIIDIIEDFQFNTNLVLELFIDETKYEGRKKKADFQLLLNNNYENLKNIEEMNLKKTIEKGIKEIDGLNLLNILDILKTDNKIDLIQNIFDKKLDKKIRYRIDSFLILKSYIELILKNNINIHYKDNMKIIVNKKFFNPKKDIEDFDIIKISLIFDMFIEIKTFIEYIFVEEYEAIKILFEKGPDKFNDNLHKYLNIDLSHLLIKLNNEFIKMEQDEIFVFLNKDNLKKELEMLSKFTFEEEEKEEIIIQDELIKELNELSNLGIKIQNRFNEKIKEKKEEITVEIMNKKEFKIDESNIDFYIIELKKYNKPFLNFLICKLLLLKKRLIIINKESNETIKLE